MHCSRITSRAIWISLLIALCWGLAAPAALADCEGNLLVNGGFEGGFSERGSGEVAVANGWNLWYQDGPGQEQGLNHRPEYDAEDANLHGTRRIREGSYAQKWGKVYATHHAGVYQQVNVPAGSGLRLTAWAQSWSSAQDDPGVSDGGQYAVSVGIDPTGGTDWSSPNVVWSARSGTMDQWVQLAVDAKAQAGTVTVYLRGDAEWPLKHNDAYFDDVCLLYTAAPTKTPAPTNTPAPTAEPTATPAGGATAPTATPQPAAAATATPEPEKGAPQVHVVRPGEALSTIAAKYGVTTAELAEANNMRLSDILAVGRELIIPGTVAEPTATPEPSATPTPAGGRVRASVFDDTNGNGLRDAGEPLLAGARLILLSARGEVLAEYTTDGVAETYTFEGLPPGTYAVREEAPAGYASTSANEWTVPLEVTSEMDVFFGGRVAEPVAPGEGIPSGAAGESAEPAGSEGSVSRVGVGISGYAGILVALLAVVLPVGMRLVRGRQ